jgi:hypothetical protein
MHHASFTSQDFQRSYRAEPRAYCADCHAPLRLEDGTRDATSGIGCASCHDVTEGHLEHGVSAPRPHVTTRACRGCHDFDVPGAPGAILQSTAREQAATSFASMTCDGCHMAAAAPGRRDHRFAVARNAALLGRALAVSPARVDAGGVVVQLATHGVGHRFPTGDLYRRLTVSLTAYDDRGALVAGDTFHLGRDWDAHRASLGSHLPEAVGADSRLSETARDFRIACAKAPARVHLTVVYERGVAAAGAFFEAFDRIEILDTDLPMTHTATPVLRAAITWAGSR